MTGFLVCCAENLNKTRAAQRRPIQREFLVIHLGNTKHFVIATSRNDAD